jgi:hypothetical protein
MTIRDSDGASVRAVDRRLLLCRSQPPAPAIGLRLVGYSRRGQLLAEATYPDPVAEARGSWRPGSATIHDTRRWLRAGHFDAPVGTSGHPDLFDRPVAAGAIMAFADAILHPIGFGSGRDFEPVPPTFTGSRRSRRRSSASPGPPLSDAWEGRDTSREVPTSSGRWA